jgi:hypothetical protein
MSDGPPETAGASIWSAATKIPTVASAHTIHNAFDLIKFIEILFWLINYCRSVLVTPLLG